MDLYAMSARFNKAYAEISLPYYFIPRLHLATTQPATDALARNNNASATNQQ